MSMPLDKQVVSLEMAKRIKELGVKQESYFSYFVLPDEEVYLLTSVAFSESIEKYSAFSVSELGEIFHNSFNEWAQGYDDSGCFYHFQYGPKGAGYMMETPMFGKKFSALDSETEADARAEFLIHLIKEGVVKV